MSEGGVSEHGGTSSRRPRRRVPSWARRTILGVVVAGLVGVNAWVLRKQYPPVERRKNAAYDAGLKALDLDKAEGRFARAEVEFRRYLEIEPRQSRVRYLLAVALQFQGKKDEAKAEYARMLEEAPNSDDARVALAELAQADQAYEEAFAQLDLAAKEEPTPTAAYVLRARLRASTGDQERAVAAYREVLRRDAESYESAIELGDLLMARSVLGGSTSDRQAAAAVYRDAEEILRRRLANTDDKRLRLLLAKAIAGQARVLQARELGEAVAELRRAAELDPEDPEPTLLLGAFFRSSGNLEEARRILEDARTKWKRPSVLVALHELYAEQRRTDDAVKVLQDAVAAWREDASLRVRLVGYLTTLARLDDAEREADAAQQLFPKQEQVHAARGDLHRERAVRAESAGDAKTAEAERAKALAAYRRALDLQPHSLRLKKLIAAELIEGMVRKGPGAAMTPDEQFARSAIEEVLRVNAHDAEALGWQSRLLLADGRFKEIVKSLRPVLDTPAPPLDTLRILGMAASKLGEHRLAADAFVRVVAMQRDPDREKSGAAGAGPPPEDWGNAIHAALDAGRVEVAVELGATAVRRHPEAVNLRRELGAAHLTKGDTAAALKVLREARAEFPQDPAVRFLLARTWEQGGRIDAAEDELKTAVVELPGESSRREYFEFLGRTGRAELAEQGFLAMVVSDPTSPAGHLKLGDFYLALRPSRPQAALEQYQKALELTHGAPQVLLRIAELELGLAARDAGAFAEAEKVVGAYVKAVPDDPWCDYLHGKLALAGGRPAEAVDLLTRFTEKVPQVSAGFFYLSNALKGAGRVEEALAAMEGAAKLAPQDASLALDLALLRHEAGIKAFQKGDFASAQRLFSLAEQGGARRGSRLLLAGAQANAGALDLSEKELRKLLADEPRSQVALHLLAQVVLARGAKEQLDEVESLYRRLLDIDATDLQARLGIGIVLFERGDIRNALDVLREVYPRTDGAPSVALFIAQCMAILNDSAGAADFLDAEIKSHPKSDALHHIKGDFLVHLRHPQDAVREFLAAYEINPENQGALLAAAAALMDVRDYEAARRLLTEKLPQSKQPALVHLALGEVLLLAGRTDDGAAELRQTLAQSPGHPRAVFLLGRIAERAGQAADAKRLYREAVQHGAAEAEPYARLAQMASGEGDRKTAIELYTTALRFQPRNPYMLNNLAVLLSEEEGRMEEALKAAATAASLAPDVPEIADTCGWLLFRNARVKEAAAYLEPAVAKLKTNPVLLFHAGMALSRLSRRLEARDLLDSALRLDPKFEGADAARAELEKLR